MVSLDWLLLLLVVAALGAQLWATRRTLHSESRVKADVTVELDKARADLASLVETAEGFYERARAERSRVDGRRGGRPRRDEDVPQVPPIQTREQYISWLERGGRPIPDVERALGL